MQFCCIGHTSRCHQKLFYGISILRLFLPLLQSLPPPVIIRIHTRAHTAHMLPFPLALAKRGADGWHRRGKKNSLSVVDGEGGRERDLEGIKGEREREGEIIVFSA